MIKEINYSEPEELTISSARKSALGLNIGEEARIINIPDKRMQAQEFSFFQQAHTHAYLQLPEDSFEEDIGPDWYSLRRIV